MAIDLKKMKQKLTALNNKGGGKTQFWSPKEGQNYSIRILPDAGGDPFREYWFHYNVSKSGVLCPKKNFGEDCPICNFAAKLYKEKTEESTKMAKTFNPRQRFFSAIVVRGEEKEGVKVWGYGKNAYQDLLNLVTNDEYGDITDTNTGTDLKVLASKAAGQQFAVTKLTPARSSSKLCKDPQECQDLLESYPVFEELHKRVTFAEAQAVLDAYINSDATDEDAEAQSTETTKYGTSTKSKASDPVESAFEELMDL
jgi:hypothetical protein